MADDSVNSARTSFNKTFKKEKPFDVALLSILGFLIALFLLMIVTALLEVAWDQLMAMWKQGSFKLSLADSLACCLTCLLFHPTLVQTCYLDVLTSRSFQLLWQATDLHRSCHPWLAQSGEQRDCQG
jgi:ABC-type sulfate transport system permease component